MATVANAESAATGTAKKLEDHSEAYKSLVSHLQSITHLGRASAVLSYDQMVHMPQAPETAGERGKQKAALAAVLHETSTDKKILEWIEKAEKDLASLKKEDFKDETRLLELEKKEFIKNERVPAELAKKVAELSSKAYGIWAKAKTENDFASFAPVLKDCFDTAVQVAKAEMGTQSNDDENAVYAQMLDNFETGMDPARIDQIFDQVEQALVPFIVKVLASPTPPSTDALRGAGHFPIDKQQLLGKKIVEAMGFDTAHGRMDVSVHPFTTSFSPRDVRITSRYKETEWHQGLAASMHEGGHAIYEQSLPPTSALGIDKALSLGTHESQSLFWERHVGLSRPFWDYATPILKEIFEDFDYTPEQVYAAVNHVERSLIRVEADELTYPLHVILRYKIERDVVQGKMEVKDMPERWKKDMKESLQIDVPDDTQGCLQDVHWPSMAIGYFPTYLIGSTTAAQLAHYCRKDFPNFDELVRKGEFAEIKAWLTDKVHRHGRRYKSLDELLEDQLGEKLNPAYFIDYLTEKYSALYQI